MATSLVRTSSQSDLAVGSYELSKSRDSNQDSFGTISGLQLGSPGKKSHLDVVSTGCRKEYYMGEGGGFLRVRAVVCLVVRNARGLSQHPRVSRNVATLALARDQGKGVARCGPNSRPGSAIV